MVNETVGQTEGTEAAPQEPPEEPETIEQPPEELQPPQPPRTMPDEAYKGMQRELQREKDRVQRLESELQEVRQQQMTGADPLAQQAQAFANQVYNAQIRDGVDQKQAQESFNLAYQAAYSSYRLQQIEGERQVERTRREKEEQARNTLDEMRELARDAGVDPDDPGLNYGDSWIEDTAQKMRVFRQSLKVVRGKADAQRPAPPQRPPDRSGARVERGEPAGTAPSQSVDDLTVEQAVKLEKEGKLDPLLKRS